MGVKARLWSIWDKIDDWLNTEVYSWVRRIDIILVVGFVLTVGYYWWAYNWRAALLGAGVYVIMAIGGLLNRA